LPILRLSTPSGLANYGGQAGRANFPAFAKATADRHPTLPFCYFSVKRNFYSKADPINIFAQSKIKFTKVNIILHRQSFNEKCGILYF